MEVLKMLFDNSDNGPVFLCLESKENKGIDGREPVMLAKIVDFKDDHIMVSPKGEPQRIIPIDGNTNVSRVEAGRVFFIC